MKKYMHFEGLRGVAALVVFFAHFRPTFCTDINKTFLDYIGITGLAQRAALENFISLFYEGTLPVYIFWYMSAFVISIKLYDYSRNENNKYLIEASTKRYVRLAIPVFFSSLICFLLMKAHWIYNLELAEQLGKGYQDGWLHLWYNFEPGIIHFLKTTIVEVFIHGNPNYNIALWTMNPELMGSFLCFGLFAVIGKNKKRFVIFLSMCIFLTIAGLSDTICFYYLVFVLGLMWCDAINSLDEEVYLKNRLKNIFNSRLTAVLLLTIGFCMTIYSDSVNPLPINLYYLFNFPVKAIGFTLLVNNFNLIKKIFSMKPMIFFGKISFSFYLIHIPIMFSIGIYLYSFAGIESEYKTLIVFGSLIVITVILSYLFMRLIDNKGISISNKVGKYFSSGGLKPKNS